MNSQATWLNWLTPFNRDAEVSWNSGGLIDRFVERAFRTSNNLNIAKSSIETRVQNLDRQFAAQASRQRTDKKALILHNSQKPRDNPDEFHTDSDADPGIVIYKNPASGH